MSFVKFKNQYVELADGRSANNEVMNSFFFLALAGACCHNHNIVVDRFGIKDLRVHPFVIQPSRTGKGEALKVLQEAVDYCGLKYTNEIQFTDSGVVGNIDANIQLQNRKKGLSPRDPDYVNPVTIGDLGLYDVISFSEGKQMIKVNAYSEDKLELLQSAMDTPGIIRKKLSGEQPLIIRCNACIVGTTYFLEDLEQIFLEQGIFQRMLVYVRPYTIEDREELNKKLCFDEPVSSGGDFADMLKDFCNELMVQIRKTPEGTVVTFSKSGKEALFRRISKWTDEVKADYTGQERNIIEGYTTSIFNQYSKIAAIAAILNGKTEIGTKEVNQAHVFVSKYLRSIMTEILTRVSGVDESQVSFYITKMVKNATKSDKKGVPIDGMERAKIVVKTQEKFHSVSETRVQRIINDLKGRHGVLTEITVKENSEAVKKIAMRKM